MPRACCLCGWLPLWWLLATAPVAAQDGRVPKDDVEKNELWPKDLDLDTTSLHELAKKVCDRAGTPEAKVTEDLVEEVKSKSEIVAKGFTETPDKGGFLPNILSIRGAELVPSQLSKVVEGCSRAATSIDAEAGCSSDWNAYFATMAIPFAIPLILGVLIGGMHWVCCFVACCRCCRRMACCKERLSPRQASHTTVILTMLVWIPTGVAIFASGLSVHYNNYTLHQVVDKHLCTVLQLADEAIGGSNDMMFLGTEQILEKLNLVADALDFDGTSMHTVRKVIDQTQDFAIKQDQLLRRVDHISTVLQMTGPTVRAFEHRCAFCSLAVGDKDYVYQGFPAEGLLPAIASGIAESSSQAMDGIRQFTSTRLTGNNLTALASKVKRSIGAYGIFDSALRATFIDMWANRLPSVDTAESLRVAIFILVGMLAMSSVPLGWLGFFLTRVRLKLRKGVVPSGKNHCCSWCCGFCSATLSLLLGGALVVAALFTGEGCILMREELLDHAGLEHHAAALGLSPLQAGQESGYFDGATWQAASRVAVGLAQTCFTVNGTGNMLSQMQLEEPFGFQPELSSAFWVLEDRILEPPAGHTTASYLSILQASAQQFGGTFVLDPLPAQQGDNHSLGVLELNPNVKALLLGSSIVPEDSKSPDGQAIVGGLNAYAALIAGPGKYTFQSGTAGGGFVITPTRPSSEELSSLPINVRNALLYGRAKERFLVSNDSLRCDELDLITGTVTERRCGVQAFHDYVVAEVARLTQAMEASSAAALLVQHSFLNELREELSPTLRLVRDIRLQTECRFLWRRIEALDTATCEELSSTLARVGCMNLALAFVGLIGTVVHYKVWRHLKDNKVIGLEMLRFEKTYKKFQLRMKDVENSKVVADRKRRANEQAVADMTANALEGGPKGVAQFDSTAADTKKKHVKMGDAAAMKH